MPVIVRPAQPSDLPTLVDFNCYLARETEDKELDCAIVEKGVSALLNDPNRGFYFVAQDSESGEVVGQLQITREWSDWRNGWFWWLQSVYVRADARKKGVFRQLHEHMEVQARTDPTVVGLRLYVEAENIAAQRVYQCLGLEQIPFRLYQKWPLD